MANKQIKDLDLIGANLNAASDFLIIQKPNGSTYKVTVDQLINSSTTVAYGAAVGAPTIISETFGYGVGDYTAVPGSNNISKTISINNIFAEGSAGVIYFSITDSTYRPLRGKVANISISKAAGADWVTIADPSAPATILQTQGQFIDRNHELGRYRISATKDSITLQFKPQHRWVGTGQISIVPN